MIAFSKMQQLPELPVYAELYEVNPEALVAEGFDECFVGFTLGPGESVAVYDHDACVQTLAEKKKITADEAAAYIAREVILVYVGENAPLFLHIKKNNA